MKYLNYIILSLILFQLNLGYGQVLSTHPRLFLDSDVVSKLKSRKNANTDEWKKEKERLDAYYNWSGQDIINDYIGQYEYIMTYALGYYASDNQAYMDKAIDILMAFYNATTDASIEFDSGYRSRSYLFYMALGYDWCYNNMTSAQREQIRDRIITWADWVKANGYARWGSQYFEPGNNYSAGHLVGITSAGYAIYSENEKKGNEYRTYSLNTISDILPFINTRLRGGDANEGWSYGSGYAMNLFYTFAIIKTASMDHKDYFLDTTWDEEVIQFLIYATLPDRKYLLPNGDWARESTGLIWDQHRTVSDLISTYSDKKTARQIACYWGRETYPSSDFHNFYVWRPFLFYNNEEQILDYKTVAPFNHKYWTFTDSSGTGQFLQRTDWSSSATWVSFRAGGMFGDHAHNGNGHVEIWENGWLVIDDNILSSSGTLIPDYAHNMVQIQPMSETWNLPKNPYHLAEHAIIPRREFTTKYSYIWENSTNVYEKQADNTAVKAERQFFYLPTEKIVITFDIVETVNASYYKKNRWHFYGTPSLNGNIISYSNGVSKIYCHPIFPLNPKITINNNTVDIEYGTAEKKNYYITVLYTNSNNSSYYKVRGISRDAGNVQDSDLFGAYIPIGTLSNSVVFVSDSPAYSYDHLAYSVPDNKYSNNYIVGLQPSTIYYVNIQSGSGTMSVDVNLIETNGSTPNNTTENGVLFFTNTGEASPQKPIDIRLMK